MAGLRPSTRRFLMSAGFAGLVIVLVFLRSFIRLETAVGSGHRAETLKTFLAEGSFFGVVFVLGVGMAWLRLKQDRRARSRRQPPLTFD